MPTITEQSTLTKSQKKTFGPKPISGWGTGALIKAEVRYDDECGNGHNSFSITGTIYIPGDRESPGYFRTRKLRIDSKFASELIKAMKDTANKFDLWAKGEQEMQDREAEEKRKSREAIRQQRMKEAGPDMFKWFEQNVAALTVAATVCETNGQEHTADVLKTLAEEGREFLVRVNHPRVTDKAS